MAVHHLAADDVFGTWENAVVGVGIEAHEFVFIDKRDVDGQVLIDEIDLLEREAAGGHVEQGVLSRCGVAVFRQQPLQFAGKAFGSGSRRGGLRSGGGGGGVDRDKGKTNLAVALLHVLKLGGRNHGQRGGIEDGFLLLHQVAAVIDEVLTFGNEGLFIAGIEQLAAVANEVAHHVVERPHRGGGAVEAFAFEHGVELVLLAGVVGGILAELVEEFEPLVFNDGILHEILDSEEQAAEGIVFGIVVRNRMVGRQVGARGVHETFKKFDFLRHVLTDALIVGVFRHGLLNEGEVVGADAAHALGNFGTSLFEGNSAFDKSGFDVENGGHFVEIHLREVGFHVGGHKGVVFGRMMK